MYFYESCLILSAQVPDNDVDALVEKLLKPLREGGAEFRKTCRWGRRRLAYPIEKQADGIFIVIYYDMKTPGSAISTFERNCRYDDNVLRVQTIKVPKKIHGEEIVPVFPEPGYAADFNMAPRPRHARRREGEAFDRGPRRDRGPRDEEPRPEGADESPVAVEGGEDSEA